MRLFIVIAGLAIGGAALASRVADRVSPDAAVAKAAQPAMAAAPAASVATPPGARRLVLAQDRQGHFRATAQVDGRPVKFVVDTGATVVALTEADAARLGIELNDKQFYARIRTANGTASAAPTRLSAINIGGITLRDVDAVVIRGRGLGENLLGNSFLSRLKRYEFSQGTLVLEQ